MNKENLHFILVLCSVALFSLSALFQTLDFRLRHEYPNCTEYVQQGLLLCRKD